MPVRTALGPTSMTVFTPDPARACMPRWNSTDCSTCSAQYSGVATAAVAFSPVTFEISWMGPLGA